LKRLFSLLEQSRHLCAQFLSVLWAKLSEFLEQALLHRLDLSDCARSRCLHFSRQLVLHFTQEFWVELKLPFGHRRFPLFAPALNA
jgi:hypothetical protein